VSSFERILPFVRPIEHLLRDQTVTEVMVNAGGRRVFVERAGSLEEVEGLVLEERNLKVAIKNIARTCGDEISDAQPILDARLEDGSRVAAMFPPCSVNGPTLTIRKFTHRYNLNELVDIGTLPRAVTGPGQPPVTRGVSERIQETLRACLGHEVIHAVALDVGRRATDDEVEPLRRPSLDSGHVGRHEAEPNDVVRWGLRRDRDGRTQHPSGHQKPADPCGPPVARHAPSHRGAAGSASVR